MKKKIIGRTAVVKTNVHLVDSGVEKEVKSIEKAGKAKMLSDHPSSVGCSLSATINMGNYQALKVSVSVIDPCEPADKQETFDNAVAFVVQNLDRVIKESKEEFFGESDDEVV